MRFLLFDRITSIEPGKRVTGVKCVNLTDESLRGHFDRRAVVPGSLVIESMIQLTAWAAITKHDFVYSVVLSVLEDAQVPSALTPGHRIDLFGELLGTNPKGSMARTWAEIDGERIASVGRVIYAHMPVPDPDALRAQYRYLNGPQLELDS